MPVRRFLVIHFTSGASAESSIQFWRTPAAKAASAHLVIDRDGTVYQTRPFDRTCGHAGVSEWQGFKNLNTCTIGIELANAGNDARLAQRWTKLPLVSAKHKNGGPYKRWEAYPLAQLAACEAVSKALVTRYHLDDIVGHDDIAPTRKNDPGPAFPLDHLRRSVQRRLSRECPSPIHRVTRTTHECAKLVKSRLEHIFDSRRGRHLC
jgi:N-acetylmuramoyl-L-alanine amidase